MRLRPLFALCLLLSAPAAAEERTRAFGVMEATAFAPVPSGAPIAVRPSDSTPRSREMAAALAAALAALGHPSDPGAALLLAFRISDAPGVRAPRPPDVELRGALGSEGHEDAEIVLRMQMFDRGNPGSRTRTHLLIVELTERSGRPLWEARIEASAAIDDDVALIEALAPDIFKRLGSSAYNLTIPETSR
jgi:hypothetical protein